MSLHEESGSVVDNDINITNYVLVNARRRLDFALDLRASLWSLIGGKTHGSAKHLLDTQLEVSWELFIVVQAFLKETSDATQMTDEDIANVVTILNDALGDGSTLTNELKTANVIFNTTSAIVSYINASEVREVFLKSSPPTSAPSAPPTGFYDNAKLDEGRELGPLAVMGCHHTQ